MKQYFCIIAKGDVPIFQTPLSGTAAAASAATGAQAGGGGGGGREDLVQFILHASLDSVEQRVWQSAGMMFKSVDKFNDVHISAFVTAGHTKFLLLHDPHKDEMLIKAFFYEVYELYIKIMLNPFYGQRNLSLLRADERNRTGAGPVFARSDCRLTHAPAYVRLCVLSAQRKTAPSPRASSTNACAH
jgi:hypothetical protein